MKEVRCERQVLKHCGHKRAERMERALKFPWLGKEVHIKWPTLPLWFAQY